MFTRGWRRGHRNSSGCQRENFWSGKVHPHRRSPIYQLHATIHINGGSQMLPEVISTIARASNHYMDEVGSACHKLFSNRAWIPGSMTAGCIGALRRRRAWRIRPRGGIPPPANGKTAAQWAPAGLFSAPCTQKCQTRTLPLIPPSLRASHVPLAATVGNRQSANQPFQK